MPHFSSKRTGVYILRLLRAVVVGEVRNTPVEPKANLPGATVPLFGDDEPPDTVRGDSTVTAVSMV